MKVALMAKNKISFVDGSILPPLPSDPLYGAWQRCNTMVLAWIHRPVSESILQSVLWIDKAFEVWKNLKFGTRFRMFSKPILKQNSEFLFSSKRV